MPFIRNTLFTLLTVTFLSVASPARAESSTSGLPAQIENVFALLEQLGLDKVLAIPGLNLPGNIPIGGCSPSMTWNGLSVDFRFIHSAACPLNGNVRMGVLPMRAEVRLQIYNTPGLEAVDFDAQMTLRLRNGGMVLNYQVLNGRVAVRPLPTMAVQEFNMNALGVRERSGRNLSVNSRMNLFERQSQMGYALVRQITRTESGTTRNAQVCSLSGGDATNVNGGTLTQCRALNR